MSSEPGVGPDLPLNRRTRSYAALCAGVSLVAVFLVIYSQVMAFAWDEGFHLLAAQLIQRGERPYLDFFFPQTPLNAYWNAAWMQVFSGGWRTTHAVAAGLVTAAILLTADFVYSRTTPRTWQLAAPLAAVILFGLNSPVVEFGPIAQAYAICIFLLTAAFRLSAACVSRNGIWLPALAGFLSSAAAGCSLLSAPAAPVLLIWIGVFNRTGGRWRKLLAFVSGGVIALTPILRLWMTSPDQVIFNIVKYHLYYRQVEWSGALVHDFFEVMLSWTDSISALLLGSLGAAGLWYVMRRSGWDRPRRAEYYLCAWLTLALAIHVSSAHPTFPRYFILVVPFVSIVAAVGLFAATERLDISKRPLWLVLAIFMVLSLALVRKLYDSREDRVWVDMEKIAQKVDEVTAREATLLADEHIYFLTRRQPPSGMESEDSHKLTISVEEGARLHVVPKTELIRQIKDGRFSTAQTCADDEDMGKLGLPSAYSQRVKMDECTVFWEPKR